MSVILIAGASRGIGAHLARRLHQSGHDVFAGMRRPSASNEVRDLFGCDRFNVVQVDVLQREEAESAVGRVLDQMGRIDVLINNAGVASLAPLELQSETVLRQTMETNFFGALRMIQAVLPAMRKQRSGKIINISSLAAFHGLPAEAAYCASKRALEIASQSLALEVERFGIQVTSIRPGYTSTGLATSDVASCVPRETEYEPLLQHLEELYQQSAEAAESPELIASAVEGALASDAPCPRIELGELAVAVAVVREGDAREQLNAMRAVHALDWWRRGDPKPTRKSTP